MTEERAGPVTGVILAGGKSSRFGSNKAFALMEGIPLIERVLAVLKGLFPQNILITNNPCQYRHLGLPMHEDIIKGAGPLGGIYTGLTAIHTPWAFVAACDQPFLNPGLIRHMLGLMEGNDAVVPRMDWKIEPLHALFSRRCLAPVERLVKNGAYQVIGFLSEVKVKYIDADEIALFDPDFRSFVNVNRPEEIFRATEKKRGPG
jgi:molybdopterin-guanine dinucleotide biosynthesis protein A